MTAEAKTCKWVGGNDIIWCLECGEEYDYRREERPVCPEPSLERTSESSDG